MISSKEYVKVSFHFPRDNVVKRRDSSVGRWLVLMKWRWTENNQFLRWRRESPSSLTAKSVRFEDVVLSALSQSSILSFIGHGFVGAEVRNVEIFENWSGEEFFCELSCDTSLKKLECFRYLFVQLFVTSAWHWRASRLTRVHLCVLDALFSFLFFFFFPPGYSDMTPFMSILWRLQRLIRPHLSFK